MTVPLDYANPTVKQISLALIRLPATDQANRVGSLVTNPGGPGGSGVEFVRDSAEGIFSADLRARYGTAGKIRADEFTWKKVAARRADAILQRLTLAP